MIFVNLSLHILTNSRQCALDGGGGEGGKEGRRQRERVRGREGGRKGEREREQKQGYSLM